MVIKSLSYSLQNPKSLFYAPFTHFHSFFPLLEANWRVFFLQLDASLCEKGFFPPRDGLYWLRKVSLNRGIWQIDDWPRLRLLLFLFFFKFLTDIKKGDPSISNGLQLSILIDYETFLSLEL